MDEKNDQMIQKLTSAHRDKTWDECGIEEKVERLRRELMGWRWQITDLRRRTETFENHQHDSRGEIVVPLHSRSHGVGEASTRDMLA